MSDKIKEEINGNIGVNIDKAVKFLKDDDIIVFPTETVYGIGANALSSNAVSKIFKAKNRPADNPLIVHISNYDMLNNIVLEINDLEKQIMDKFWPGPISIILKKKNHILPDNVTAKLETVAVRMPDNNIALELINKCNFPIAAPSANISSRPSGTNIKDIYDELKSNISYFIDDNDAVIGIESTVVRVIDDTIVILRPGYITMEDLETITLNVKFDSNVLNKVSVDDKVLSPGMKHKHYSPNVNCSLIKFTNSNDILKSILNSDDFSDKVALLLTKESIIKLDKDLLKKYSNVKVINLGNDLEDVSKDLFKNLRSLNKLGVDKAYIQSFSFEGLGISIMNRLIRACEYREIDINNMIRK